VLPANAPPISLLVFIVAISLQSSLCFHGYALLFSSGPIMRKYIAMRRWFEGLFALAFAAAGLKILTTRI
jgi:threonine/homoserine/homoserine lactone efflux protein